MQAAGGVDDDDVTQVVDSILDALARDLHRVLALAGVHAHTHFGAERLQLVDSGRTVHVAGHEQGLVVLLAQAVCQLGRSRGLARALQADEHDDVRDAARELEAMGLATEELGELVHDHADDVLRRGEARKHLGPHALRLGLGDKILHHQVIHVSFQHRHTNLAHGRIDVVLGELALAAQVAEDAAQPSRKVL